MSWHADKRVMRSRIKRAVIFLYCRGIIPAFAVLAIFRIFKLRSV